MISLDFSGKLILVTGGGRGIGLAITRALAEAGADIAITYTSTDASTVATKLSTEFNVTVRAYKCDTANSKQVDSSLADINKEFGKQVDIGICNAGISLWRDTHDMADGKSTFELQNMFAVNAFGPIYTARSLVRSWLDLPIPVPSSEAEYTPLSTFTQSDKKEGVVVPSPRLKGKQLLFVSSISGLVAMSPQNQAAYNGSKAALTMMAKSLAGEWAPLGVSVNAISPGYVSTEMIANPPDKKAETWVQEWQSRTPAGHFASAETLGRFIALLVSDRAGGSGFMTGSDIVMDGGELGV
ncbi:hypothetical protein QFC22_005458 [Naganishia vaughanmartiniae]|uniref:Uncharacterized protein n=1 Tax=Naganishia vaughanmartiniae TaxID=1424756 RepID=A0ACC2WUL1_9TREE|nr:hypothetical protein QFC22_005458 [Naganishia vaughanmartiniae]